MIPARAQRAGAFGWAVNELHTDKPICSLPNHEVDI